MFYFNVFVVELLVKVKKLIKTNIHKMSVLVVFRTEGKILLVHYSQSYTHLHNKFSFSSLSELDLKVHRELQNGEKFISSTS